jgi:hypothetical protein
LIFIFLSLPWKKSQFCNERFDFYNIKPVLSSLFEYLAHPPLRQFSFLLRGSWWLESPAKGGISEPGDVGNSIDLTPIWRKVKVDKERKSIDRGCV